MEVNLVVLEDFDIECHQCSDTIKVLEGIVQHPEGIREMFSLKVAQNMLLKHVMYRHVVFRSKNKYLTGDIIEIGETEVKIEPSGNNGFYIVKWEDVYIHGVVR